MRFGGHETFPIREGWLHKGLDLLINQPELLVDEYSADWLGVGRNMAKSIRYWLVATGLATSSLDKKTRKSLLSPSSIGKLVWKHDRYFTETGTWWALHINLINNPSFAFSWNWFFNIFSLNRFDKSLCVEALRGYLSIQNPRLPKPMTLQRDIGCLLDSYSRVLPSRNEDPEMRFDCPFAELGLMSYHRTSGYYQLHRERKHYPPHLLGYAIAQCPQIANGRNGIVDITIAEATTMSSGPGRIFVLDAENLFESILTIENELKDIDIQISGLAGERMLCVKRRSAEEWLAEYYSANEHNPGNKHENRLNEL
jgi:hypothetical protein